MAGDWIKMRVNLVSHPKVLALAETLATDGDYQEWSTMAGFVPSIGGSRDDYDRDYQASLRVTRYVTVCALLRFWGYANEHAKDEFIGSLRLRDIDDVVQVPGFGAALQAIGWAEYDPDRRGLSLPNFNEYNTSGNERSAGAKSAAQRQKEYRDRKKASDGDVTRDDESDVTRNRREEKRREEKKDVAASFDIFWAAYPRKEAKKDALSAFAKLNPNSELLTVILAAISTKAASADWTKENGKYVPLPASWLRAERWTDEGVTLAAVGGDRIGSFI